MRWQEDESKWLTTTSWGDKITSRFVIPAAGPLYKPKLPGIKGIETFKDHCFYTSR
jgi:cation diffusion facilitator CzcD-associated flavoprotein CzcO